MLPWKPSVQPLVLKDSVFVLGNLFFCNYFLKKLELQSTVTLTVTELSFTLIYVP